jgi:hypothetical protein
MLGYTSEVSFQSDYFSNLLIGKDKSLKKDRISRKDVFVLGAVYIGLLSLVLVLPENNSILSGIALAVYAIASFIAVDHIK